MGFGVGVADGELSLKKVVPSLVPDVSYAGLGVADGDNASAVYARMARGEIKDVARRQLLAYCKTDTLVMVRLHEILADMAAGRWQSRGNLPC